MYPYKSRYNQADVETKAFVGVEEYEENKESLKTHEFLKSNKDKDNDYDYDEPSIKEYVEILIEDAIINECSNVKYYKALENQVTNPNDKKIINSTYLISKKNEAMFRALYKEITGTDFKGECLARELSDNVVNNFAQSIVSNVEDVDSYRKIYFSFLNLQYRDWIYEIITDKQNNIGLFNYLYAKYK